MPTKKFKDMTGQRFGKLVAIEAVKIPNDRSYYWRCQCDCGNEAIILGDHLRSGHTKSCGCYRSESCAKLHSTHGMTKHSLFIVYADMRARCLNTKDAAYKYYGGRGIKICDEWLENKISFFDWAFANGYEEGLTLDRIDNDGDYCPENCRWVTAEVQANNRRYCRYVEYDGRRQTVAQWAKEVGMRPGTLLARLNAGWSVKDALTRPLRIWPSCKSTQEGKNE